jgi:hypothetical protein
MTKPEILNQISEMSTKISSKDKNNKGLSNKDVTDSLIIIGNAIEFLLNNDQNNLKEEDIKSDSKENTKEEKQETSQFNIPTNVETGDILHDLGIEGTSWKVVVSDRDQFVIAHMCLTTSGKRKLDTDDIHLLCNNPNIKSLKDQGYEIQMTKVNDDESHVLVHKDDYLKKNNLYYSVKFASVGTNGYFIVFPVDLAGHTNIRGVEAYSNDNRINSLANLGFKMATNEYYADVNSNKNESVKHN